MTNNPEYKRLIEQIREWNANRLDLFEITYPNERFEFFGVIRFFYQGEDLKYQSKCVRVSNRLTAAHLVSLLIQKFHPDMRMLSMDKYGLYENHASVPDRRLSDQEIPLVIQLNWAMDDREGKFILRNETRSRLSLVTLDNEFGFNPRLSTDIALPQSISKDRRSQSASELSMALSKSLSTDGVNHNNNNNNDVFGFKRRWSSSKRRSRKKIAIAQEQALAEAQRQDELMGKPPDSTFTRTLSNSELVMKRRRQQKLESRLKEFSTPTGSSETGGTLKIYGNKLDSKIPYKTLLLSANDPASYVLAQILEKYGISNRSTSDYCLIQVHTDYQTDGRSAPKEVSYHRLRDNDCPLGILLFDPPPRGHYRFQVDVKSDKIPLRSRAVPPGSTAKSILSNRPTTTATTTNNKTIPPSTTTTTTTPANYNNNERQISRSSARYENTNNNSSLANTNTMRPSSRADNNYSTSVPYLTEVRDDGSDRIPRRVHRLLSLVPPSISSQRIQPVRIGSSLQAVGPAPGIVLSGPTEGLQDIWPLHCILQRSNGGEGALEIVPTMSESAVNRRIHAWAPISVNKSVVAIATLLSDGDIFSLGTTGYHRFKLHDPYSPKVSTLRNSAKSPRTTLIQGRHYDVPILTSPTTTTTPTTTVTIPSSPPVKPFEVIDLSYAVLAPTDLIPVLVDFASSQDRALLNALLENAKLPTSLTQFTENTISINRQNSISNDFPLIPAYSVYCMLRAAVFDNGTPSRIQNLLALTAQTMLTVIEQQSGNIAALSFWMANASELLHFIKCDEKLHPMTLSESCVSDIAACVGQAFHSLQTAVQEDLELCVGAFYHPNWTAKDEQLSSEKGEIRLTIRLTQYFHLTRDEENNLHLGTIGHLLGVLSLCVSVLRQCRVNAALTIQLFSQLFHWINQRLFNRLINSARSNGPGRTRRDSYLCEAVCEKLHHRIRCIKSWALRQGLELAAENHLQRIEQACMLVLMDKNKEIERLYSDVTSLSALNSRQVGFILYNIQDNNLPDDWIEVLVSGVREVADRAHQEESGCYDLELLEDVDLHLPLLLPDDGYSPEQDIPNSISSVFMHLQRLYQRGLLKKCVRNEHTNARWSAYLTVYENTGPTTRSILSMGSFRGSNRYSQFNKAPTQQPPSVTSTEPIRPYETIQSPSIENGKISPPTFPPPLPKKPPIVAPQTSSNTIPEPKQNIISLQIKKVNKSLGVKIFSVKDSNQEDGVYISEIVRDGAVYRNGRLSLGDQLIKVDGVSLVNADNSAALQAMSLTGDVVTLLVDKGAAARKGLEDIVLNQIEPKNATIKKSHSRRPLPPPEETRTLEKVNRRAPEPQTRTAPRKRTPEPQETPPATPQSSSMQPKSTIDVRNLVWTETDLDTRRMRKFRPLAAITSPPPTTSGDSGGTGTGASNNKQSPDKSSNAVYAVPHASRRRPTDTIDKRRVTVQNNPPTRQGTNQSGKSMDYHAERTNLLQMEKELAPLEDRPLITLTPLERENLSRLRLSIEDARRRLLQNPNNVTVTTPLPISSTQKTKSLQEKTNVSSSSDSGSSSSEESSSETDNSKTSSSTTSSTTSYDTEDRERKAIPKPIPQEPVPRLMFNVNNSPQQSPVHKTPGNSDRPQSNYPISPQKSTENNNGNQPPKYAWRPPPPPPPHPSVQKTHSSNNNVSAAAASANSEEDRQARHARSRSEQ